MLTYPVIRREVRRLTSESLAPCVLCRSKQRNAEFRSALLEALLSVLKHGLLPAWPWPF